MDYLGSSLEILRLEKYIEKDTTSRLFLTEKGKAYFEKLVQCDITEDWQENSEVHFLLKLCFIGQLDALKRQALAENLSDYLTGQKNRMERWQKEEGLDLILPLMGLFHQKISLYLQALSPYLGK